MTSREQIRANLKKRYMACVVTLNGEIQYSIGDHPVDTVEEAEQQIVDYIYGRGVDDCFTILPFYS